MYIQWTGIISFVQAMDCPLSFQTITGHNVDFLPIGPINFETIDPENVFYNAKWRPFSIFAGFNVL